MEGCKPCDRDGWSPPLQATEQIQEYIASVKAKAEQQLNIDFKVHVAVLFIKKQESGWYYIVKIDIGVGVSNYVHGKLYVPRDGDVELLKVTGNHGKDEALDTNM